MVSLVVLRNDAPQRFLRGLSAMLFAFVLTSCTADGTDERSIVRDSAGVAIVESVAPRWDAGRAWSVAADPLLDLTTTGEGEAHDFYRVRSAIRLANGSIAVANEGSNEVRLYSPEGVFVDAFGREGEGPGEFQRLTSVHDASGDSLAAFDYWLRRITVFRMGETGSRTIDLSHFGTRVWRVVSLGEGSFAAIVHGYPAEDVQGLYRVQYTIVRFDLHGGPVDTLTTIAGSEGFQFEQGDARPLFARDGFVAGHEGGLYAGDGDSMRVAVYAGDGALEMIMRVPGFDLRLTDEERAAERATLLPETAVPPAIRDVVAALPDPETRPAYARLLVDEAGNVWAPEHQGRAEWDQPIQSAVFGPNGEWLGHVTLPARFTLYEIGEDWILGVQRDTLEAEHVQLLRIVR
jgi:hypothetical protein